MEATHLDTRMSLLQAALVRFADHGFDATSMRMIALKAGRPLSLLSHYFKNKEGLYLEVFRYLLEMGPKPLALPEQGTESGKLDRQGAVRMLREQIHLLFEASAPDNTSNQSLNSLRARLWVMEFQSPRPILHSLLMQQIGPTSEVISECIRVLRPDLDAGQVAFIGISIMGQVTAHGVMVGLNRIMWGDLPSFGSQFQQAELITEFCLSGLLRGSPIA